LDPVRELVRMGRVRERAQQQRLVFERVSELLLDHGEIGLGAGVSDGRPPWPARSAPAWRAARASSHW